MPRKNKKDKTAYMRAYRAANRDKVNAYRRAYYHKHKKAISKTRKEYYKRNQNHMRDTALAYYHAHKESCKARHKKYAETHRDQINDWARTRYYKQNGRKVPRKSFSFYRDYIKLAIKLPAEEKSKIFQDILSLPLTEQQEKLVRLTYQGHTQKEIAKLLNISQGAVCQIWNGWQSKTGIFYGGIYNKLSKAIHGKRQPKRQIPVQNLRSSLSRGVME